MNLPNHIAIIMDGNGRWGKKHFNNRLSDTKEELRILRIQ